jgi:hypothetical protein
MKKSVSWVAAVILLGNASLATAQFGAQGNKLTGTPGFSSQTLAQPPIEPSPQISNPSAVAPSPQLSTCDSTGCWGTDGARYNRAGNVLFGNNGKTCTILSSAAPAICS